MKTTKRPRPGRKRTKRKVEPLALIERKLYDRHTVNFPQVKGRVVETVEFFTMENHHNLTIEFKDKSALCLNIDPSFSLQAILAKRTREGLDVFHSWPTISLET